MTRFLTIFGLLMTILIGSGTYWISHQVETLQKRYASIQSDIFEEQENIHVLQAEWSYLNNPARIEKLAKQYLHLAPIKPMQMAGIDEVPENADIHLYRMNNMGEAVPFLPVPRARPDGLASDEAADSYIIDAPSLDDQTGDAQ